MICTHNLSNRDATFSDKRAKLRRRPPSPLQVFDAATEAGAEDVIPVEDEEQAGSFDVLTEVEAFGQVRAALEAQKLPINGEESGLVYRPTVEVEVDDEGLEKNQKMFDKLLELDDVDAVYSTCVGLDI